jgi:hypothetical protein
MQEQATSPIEDGQPTAVQVFFAWERLRLVYNLALAGVFVGWVCLSGGVVPDVVFALPEEVLAANVCFCAGPVAEGYLCWLGVDRRWSRWGIFTAGMLVAAGYAILELKRLAALGGLGT